MEEQDYSSVAILDPESLRHRPLVRDTWGLRVIHLSSEYEYVPQVVLDSLCLCPNHRDFPDAILSFCR